MVKKHLLQRTSRNLITEQFNCNGELEFNFDFLGRTSGITLERIDMDVLNSDS